MGWREQSTAALKRREGEETRRRGDEEDPQPSGSDRGQRGELGFVFNGSAKVVLVGLLKVR